MEPTQADLARARAIFAQCEEAANCHRDNAGAAAECVMSVIATALQACQADIWLEAGRMADNAGKMATVMGDINTARGQYSLADIFKSKAAAIRAADTGAGGMEHD